MQSAAALAEGNAVAAGTGLVAPLVVGAGIAAGLTWRPAVLLTLPLLLAVVVVAPAAGPRAGAGHRPAAPLGVAAAAAARGLAGV